MRTLAAIRDDGARKKASEALASGYSPDMVKAKFAAKQKPRDRREALLQERERIEKSIQRLQGQLKEIDKRLSAAEKGRG
jgi:predicted  nucleic acid-binding Zn-ribbon protein